MVTRQHERLQIEQKVTVQVADRASLKEMYIKDISRGGLFISTEQRFELRQRIQVTLQIAADNCIVLPGEVVHIVSAEQAKTWHSPPGIGVEFTALESGLKKTLEDYISGLRQNLSKDLEQSEVDTKLLQAVEEAQYNNDLFAALNLSATANEMEISLAVSVRLETLNKLWKDPRLSPKLRHRFARAIATLERCNTVLGDAEKRLRYIFRTGLVPPQELALLAEPHEVRHEIATQWSRRYPEAAETAQRLEQLAYQSKFSGDLTSARRSAKLALQQNPFLYKLRQDFLNI